MQETNYTSPLSERYPSNEMKYLFSPEIPHMAQALGCTSGS